jgi:predicted aspartyl protease
VRVDGRGPFPFVVDSGADTTAVSTLLASRLGLAKGTPATLHSMTGVGPVDRVLVGVLGLGESVVRNLELPVLREEDLGAPGLIGIDALVEQRLMMDFDRKVITIEDARRPPPRANGEVVVVARRRRGQLILTQVGVNGRRVEAVLDTGSEITIGNGALRAALEKRSRGRIETIEVLGVDGATVTMQLIRLAEIRIGPIVIRDVPIAFADVPPFAAFSLDDHPSLLLGTDLMANFRRVSLDFRARKVRFQLKRCGGVSVIVSTTATASRLSAAEPGGAVCR